MVRLISESGCVKDESRMRETYFELTLGEQLIFFSSVCIYLRLISISGSIIFKRPILTLLTFFSLLTPFIRLAGCCFGWMELDAEGPVGLDSFRASAFFSLEWCESRWTSSTGFCGLISASC